MQREAFVHYEMDIPEIDKQHWNLIELMDSIKFNVNGCVSCNRCVDIIHEIFSDLQKHFAFEEKLMREESFPFLQSHHNEHQKLIGQVNVMVSMLEDQKLRGMKCKEVMMKVLQEVLVDHIDHYDMQYSDFLRRKKDSLFF